MAELLIVAVPCLTLALLYCLWRACSLFAGWLPATAAVMSRSYADGPDDLDRLETATEALFDPLVLVWGGDEEAPPREQRVRFHTQDGEERQAFVDRPGLPYSSGRIITIWYEPQEGGAATSAGPAHWLFWAAIWALLLAIAFHFGPQWTGR